MLEAMYYSVPVVCSRNRELEELGMFNSGGAFAVDAENAQMLADKIEVLLTASQDDYKIYCNYAHEYAKQFSYEEFVKKLINKMKQTGECD